jgi:hypothetical protein
MSSSAQWISRPVELLGGDRQQGTQVRAATESFLQLADRPDKCFVPSWVGIRRGTCGLALIQSLDRSRGRRSDGIGIRAVSFSEDLI